MRFVEPNSEAQLDLQSLHRARDRLVGERTALINQLRAFLPERGIAVPQGRRKLELRLEELLAAEQPSLSPRTRLLIEDMRAQWRELDRRILAFDDEFVAHARIDEAARLLMTIPAIWRHGWGWCRSRRRREASRSCSGSASGATATCARCWSTARGRR